MQSYKNAKTEKAEIWSRQKKCMSQQKQTQDPEQEDKDSHRMSPGHGGVTLKTTGKPVASMGELQNN